MKKIKVTDLELFCLEQIYRPYQLSLGIGDKRLERLTKDFSLETARALLIHKKDWSKLVLERLSNCGFWFPDYINHPLVRFLKNAMTIDWKLYET